MKDEVAIFCMVVAMLEDKVPLEIIVQIVKELRR